MELSAAQRRIWFAQARDPEDTCLNRCAVFRLDGVLDIRRLRDAITEVADRHEVLRSTFHCDDDDRPRRVVRPRGAPAWQSADLRDLPEPGRTRRAEVLIRRVAGRPFDLPVETPLRCTVIRIGEHTHLLALVVHAIGWDEDCWEPFCAQVGARYNGTALPPVGPWATVADPGTEYWSEVLTPLPQPVELPGRIGPAAVASARAAGVTAPLAAGIAERVAEFAGANNVTSYGVLLAAYAVLIHRYTAATDFIVCVPVSLRARGEVAVEAEPIGYIADTLLLRCRMDSGSDFRTCVRATQERLDAGYAHRGSGIDRVVAALNPERSAGQDGLESLARWEFTTRRRPRFGFHGVAAEQVGLGRPSTRMPLSLTVVTDPDRFDVEITYRADEFDGRIIESLLAHYGGVLASALAGPDLPIGELDILGPRDRDRIVRQSHGEMVERPATTVVELFEHRVARTPDATAVLAPDTDAALTYRELNRRANRLARQLIRGVIGTEDIVALRMGTSVEFVVAVLAVLKSGAAYLPIDPAYPAEHAAFLIEDTGPALILDIDRLRAAERAADELPDHDPGDDERVRPLRPANLAYVVFTSGSTGIPKGVAVSHAAIAEHLDGFGSQWDMTADDRLLQSASVGFDASLVDIFLTLSIGACLVVPKPGSFSDIAFADIPYLAEVISRCGVTVLHMVPSVLSSLLMLPEVRQWRGLRHVPVGGEVLYGEVADRFAGVFDAELRNHYGPTEAVVCSTHMRVAGPQGTRIVPIGYPNRNVSLYLLDDRLQLVPAGVVGEIYLGGQQLARGYRNMRAASAERFVADPFTDGGRLYRTGDLARRNGDGELEFIGRADDQVRVHGYRIELAEVQSALTAHPDVGHCVAAAVTDPVAGSVLAAYLVPARGVTNICVDAVREFAATVLPRTMVPAAYAVIDEIPLTEHGKLDRRALPPPHLSTAELFRAPNTALEVRISEMFGAMLGRERIGADDSFFDLGGHSLLVPRLLAWILAEFGVRIEVRALFDTPTVSGLATRVETLTAHDLPIEV
ncbi:MAG: amino acid adenylation domain-containing protein [Nocardia sp.]|nr:amino acid adenylation domain-containing protein [Nocardia sp.]